MPSLAEKLYFLHRAKYDALKDLRSHYGNLLAHTDIVPSMDVLTASIQSLLSDNRVSWSSYLNRFYIEALLFFTDCFFAFDFEHFVFLLFCFFALSLLLMEFSFAW